MTNFSFSTVSIYMISWYQLKTLLPEEYSRSTFVKFLLDKTGPESSMTIGIGSCENYFITNNLCLHTFYVWIQMFQLL